MAKEVQQTQEMPHVKMIRSEPDPPGGPTTADVHPAEVENWKAHGWRIVEESKPAEKSKPKDEGEPKK
jgi:hypothetical protein